MQSLCQYLLELYCFIIFSVRIFTFYFYRIIDAFYKYKQKCIFTSKSSSDVCDIVIMRQSPDIEGYNGIPLNKFLALNSIAEIMAMPSNMSTDADNTMNASSTNEIILKYLQ